MNTWTSISRVFILSFTVSHLKLSTSIGNVPYLHACTGATQTPALTFFICAFTTCPSQRFLFMAVFAVIHSTDVRFFIFLGPLRNSERINWPPPSKVNVMFEWSLSPRARVGRAGSVESKSCTWQLSFGLHLPKNETQTSSVAPEPEPPSQLSNIQHWVILFTKQNITSNYSRPVFYSLLPHVGFITVCKCQDTYKDAQYKWYFPNYAHMFGFTWVAAERNVVPDAPPGDPPH